MIIQLKNGNILGILYIVAFNSANITYFKSNKKYIFLYQIWDGKCNLRLKNCVVCVENF